MTQNSANQPLAFDDFPSRTYDKLRYADTDRQGHVNNAVFSTFLETGRVEFLYSPEDPLAGEGASFVIANLNLQLRSEITWPGTVEIGTAITRIGKSSIQLLQGIFQNGVCAATAETVIVQIDEASRSSHPLSEEARAKLASFQVRQPE